jgi:hemerythrin-like domain-containing protein
MVEIMGKAGEKVKIGYPWNLLGAAPLLLGTVLTFYALLLTEHIRKEDEILYPWMNRELTDSQVGQLFSKFNAVNEQFKTRVEQTLALVAKLEKAAEQRS